MPFTDRGSEVTRPRNNFISRKCNSIFMRRLCTNDWMGVAIFFMLARGIANSQHDPG
jgi:hypothetical protein